MDFESETFIASLDLANMGSGGNVGWHDHTKPTITLDCNGNIGVAHSLRGEGFDASEDGTGRGTPLVPVLPFDTTQMTSAANRSQPKPGDPCHPLAAGAHAPAIAFRAKDHGADAMLDCSPTLRAGGHAGSHANAGVMPAIAFRYGDHQQDTLHHEGGVMSTLPSGNNNNAGHYTATVVGMQVRRLTPRECERLQGFPDDYTQVPHRGKPAADGPRYKALGNSWAVPCARWIGERIEAVEGALRDQREAA